MEASFVVPTDVGVDAANGQVHLGEPPGGVVALLTVDGDVADTAAVRLDEAFGLDKHAAGAATGVIDPSFDLARLVRKGLQHFHKDTHDRAGGIELPAALAFA